MSWKMHYNGLTDKDEDETWSYLMLPYIFPILERHLGFGGHLGLFWVGL